MHRPQDVTSFLDLLLELMAYLTLSILAHSPFRTVRTDVEERASSRIPIDVKIDKLTGKRSAVVLRRVEEC